MSYKTTDGLMRHLRESGIDISGSLQKRQLINTGYFHGYKGYRFFKNTQKKLPIVSYKEIYATIQYDSALKALFYSKVMYIETAIKNIALESIIVNTGSENVQDIFEKVVSGYNNAPVGYTNEQKRKLQERKLNLKKMVQSSIFDAYKKQNPKISHFYDNKGYSDVPIWALFEIISMGDFGYLLSCLTKDVRDDISKRIGINTSCDTNRELIYKYIYTLKDLRNAIAHNGVIFDTRFGNIEPTKAMKRCLEIEIGLPYINFKTIGDYLILICYYLKLLHISKTEIKSFIKEFEKITDEYKKSVNQNVASIVIHPDLSSRIGIFKNFL